MFKPYLKVDETLTHVSYRYSAICSWWLYLTLALMLVSFLVDQLVVISATLVSIVGYIIFVSIPGYRVATNIKRAARAGTVNMSGSRWSFAKPLTFRIMKGKEDGSGGGSARGSAGDDDDDDEYENERDADKRNNDGFDNNSGDSGGSGSGSDSGSDSGTGADD